MADRRELSEEYSEIGKELIETEPELRYLKGAPVSIVFLKSSHKKKSKGKIIYGQCEKVQDKNKWAIPADFTITVFEPNCEYFTDEQLRILIFHELLHVGVDYDGNHSVLPHDLEDFKLIIDRYGTDWSKNPKEDKDDKPEEKTQESNHEIDNA